MIDTKEAEVIGPEIYFKALVGTSKPWNKENSKAALLYIVLSSVVSPVKIIKGLA